MEGRIDSRTGMEELDRDECMRLLADSPLGRLAVVVADHPLVFPVNFTLDGNAIVFRTDRGTKLHGARNGPVAFECDGIDREYHTGWSVLVQGIAGGGAESARNRAARAAAVAAMVRRAEADLVALASEFRHGPAHPAPRCDLVSAIEEEERCR